MTARERAEEIVYSKPHGLGLTPDPNYILRFGSLSLPVVQDAAQMDVTLGMLRDALTAALDAHAEEAVREVEALLKDPYGLVCGMDGEDAEAARLSSRSAHSTLWGFLDWVEQGGFWIDDVDAYWKARYGTRFPARNEET